MMSMMWIDIFSPLSLFICSVVLAVIVYYILHSLVSMEHEICCTTTGKLSRRLGFFERYFLTMAKGSNTGHINTVLLLESKVRLDKDHVMKALLKLLERFPLLRMRVTERYNQPCFEEMENKGPQSLDFRRMEEVDSENWLHAFEKQINGAPFNTQQGPLWRVALLRETCDASGQESLYKNAVLFTFHHIISDALSAFELKKKLIEFLGLLYNGEAIDTQSLPFRPPIERVIQHLTRPSIWERLLIPIFMTFRNIKVYMFRKPKLENLYLLTFPPSSGQLVAHKTHAVPRNLSREETMALIRCSKANNCTVHGAITAATHLAMSQILDQRNADESRTPILIDSAYTVNIRKECQPKIESEEFGLYASFDSLQIMVNSSNMETREMFWEFARACTNEVHRSINVGKHRNGLKFFQCVDIPSVWALSHYKTEHGLHKDIFNLTNLGALSIDQEGKSPYKFAGSYLALQSAKIRWVIGNNIFTVNGQLYWTVEYSPEITSKSQAEPFVDLSLRILMDACTY